MSSGAGRALAIWRARRPRSGADRGYVAYLIVMVAIICVAPAVRALWLGATTPGALAALADPSLASTAGVVAAGLWALALVAGGFRGPALRPLLLTTIFARSDAPRARTFGGAVLVSGAALTVATTLVAGFLAAVLASHGLISAGHAGELVALGALTGVIATVAWLAGQAAPRTALAGAGGVAILLAIGLLTPAGAVLSGVTPWGWTASAWAGGASTAGAAFAIPGLPPLAALALLAVALLVCAPLLLARLESAALEVQAARWESLTAHAYGMDFAAAISIYGARPKLGRSLAAVRPARSLTATFVRRDAIGAVRTPARLVAGALGIAAGSLLIVLACTAPTPIWALGAVAAVLMFAGVGPLTDGLRHAASVASDLPLYGVSDERLVAMHAVFPAVVAALVAALGGAVSVILLGVTGTGTGTGSDASTLSILVPVLVAAGLALVAVLARVNAALKGQLSIAMLTPIPTPVGDVSVLVRLAWALDGVIVVAAAGAAVVLAGVAPVWAIAVVGGMLLVCVTRWRRRRAG
ncbi:hypothetical protein [Leucobacter japonicus]|uniref:hypothetical protein n=1 Tax=Leucobacter japonicus TaxID=1461259 RepID=UPI0006A7E30D|nr:hypothetical protein [Leucobacter japonicus]